MAANIKMKPFDQIEMLFSICFRMMYDQSKILKPKFYFKNHGCFIYLFYFFLNSFL